MVTERANLPPPVLFPGWASLFSCFVFQWIVQSLGLRRLQKWIQNSNSNLFRSQEHSLSFTGNDTYTRHHRDSRIFHLIDGASDVTRLQLDTACGIINESSLALHGH